jgi:serine/threonine-protein kinase HipA
MAEALPDHASELARNMRDDGLDHPILQQLSTLLADSSREKQHRLINPSGTG